MFAAVYQSINEAQMSSTIRMQRKMDRSIMLIRTLSVYTPAQYQVKGTAIWRLQRIMES